MDTPTPPSGAPRRVLKPSGTAPVAKRRLVSASGKTIESKAAPKLKTAAGTTTSPKPSLLKKPAAEEKVLSPEEIAAEEARLQAEHEAYEREMAEYNRQMEEYNKQVAEQEEADRIAAEKEAAEKAEADRIAAEKAAAEKAEADRIAAEKAAAEKVEADRLAAIEKAAADAARVAQAAEQAAALAAAKLAAAETALAATAAAQAAADALEAAKAAGVKEVNIAPAPQPDGAAKAKAPSTALLRSAAASAAVKTGAKPPATKMLLAAGKSAPKVAASSATEESSEAAETPQAASPTTKLGAAAPKLTKAASTTKLQATAPAKTKLAKAAAPKTGLSLNKLAGIKKPAPKPAEQPAVPAPDAEAAPATEQAPAPAPELEASPEAPAAEPSEADLSVRDAYLEALQLDAAATPIWKKPMFLVACGALLLLGGGAAYYVSSVNATKEAYAKNVAETNRLLRQAGNINKAGAETLADVEKKGIKLDCSLADAKRLMGVIVDPFQKDENGVNRYGGAPEGVAMNAGMLLGIMAEKDPAIEVMIFKSLEQDARKISPTLFSWMIQRLGVAEVKNINGKLKTLTEKIAAQPKFKTKPQQLAAIWEVMGLRVTAKDLPVILDLLKDKEIDSKLVATLAICLDNIVEMTEDTDAKLSMGDQIFDSVPVKYRAKVMRTLASACSPKALEYYKERLEDKNNWPRECEFLGAWGNDDLVDFTLELYNSSKDDTRMNPFAKGAVGIAFRQARERDQATVDKLMAVLYDKLDEDSSQWQEIINKTDEDAADFVGKDSAEYKELMAKRADLEASRRQKIGLAKAMGGMRSFTWVENLIAKLAKDSDEDVVIAAEESQEAVKANTAAFAARKATYERRAK
ncbi:MAG: hypothetical protein R3Y56_07140 [Akkermansia sp.]